MMENWTERVLFQWLTQFPCHNTHLPQTRSKFPNEFCKQNMTKQYKNLQRSEETLNTYTVDFGSLYGKIARNVKLANHDLKLIEIQSKYLSREAGFARVLFVLPCCWINICSTKACSLRRQFSTKLVEQSSTTKSQTNNSDKHEAKIAWTEHHAWY